MGRGSEQTLWEEIDRLDAPNSVAGRTVPWLGGTASWNGTLSARIHFSVRWLPAFPLRTGHRVRRRARRLSGRFVYCVAARNVDVLVSLPSSGPRSPTAPPSAPRSVARSGAGGDRNARVGALVQPQTDPRANREPASGRGRSGVLSPKRAHSAGRVTQEKQSPEFPARIRNQRWPQAGHAPARATAGRAVSPPSPSTLRYTAPRRRASAPRTSQTLSLRAAHTLRRVLPPPRQRTGSPAARSSPPGVAQYPSAGRKNTLLTLPA